MSVRNRIIEHRLHGTMRRGERKRRRVLEEEIGTLTSVADRADLAALLMRYDDSKTAELRTLLVSQDAKAARATSRPWRRVAGI